MDMYFWAKFYLSVIENRKINALSFEDRWHFIVLLCMKQQGLLDYHDLGITLRELKEKIGVRTGLQLSELDKVKYRLIESGLIDSEWNPSLTF